MRSILSGKAPWQNSQACEKKPKDSTDGGGIAIPPADNSAVG